MHDIQPPDPDFNPGPPNYVEEWQWLIRDVSLVLNARKQSPQIHNILIDTKLICKREMRICYDRNYEELQLILK
jgi:hypothetical protein